MIRFDLFASARVRTPYRSDGLLSLRGIAAFLVVCHHFAVGAAAAAATGIAVFGAFSISGSYAVFIFFAISGYLMAKILDRDYRREDIGKFYWNRALRIFPTYYLAVVFTLLFTFVVFHYPIAFDIWPVLLLVNNYILPSDFANPALWSLATEVQFYILAPLVAWLVRYSKSYALYLLAAGIAIKFVWYGTFDLLPEKNALNTVYMGLEANWMYFMAGWCSYLYQDRIPKIGAGAALILIGGVLTAIWLFHFYFIGNEPMALGHSIAWMIGFPAVISATLMFALPSLDDRGHLIAKLPRPAAGTLAFLGVTSYAAYVLHLPVYGWLNSYLPVYGWPNGPVWLKILAVYAVALAVYVFVERRFFRLRRA
jgi:peptidoglycan/LPS O-acetylase OafA/YrhL